MLQRRIPVYFASGSWFILMYPAYGTPGYSVSKVGHQDTGYSILKNTSKYTKDMSGYDLRDPRPSFPHMNTVGQTQ